MNLYENILNKNDKISVIGLGYVGMPIAVAFSKKAEVIGFDINAAKVNLYQQGIDSTHEVGDLEIANCNVDFTSDETRLKEARFHIIAVPTPIRDDKIPDLNPVESASRVVGRNLAKGSIVVYESTVYPGVTEDVCIPILEKESGLKCGIDFKVGYSPERINPGDKTHRLDNIVKIVAGMDEETLDIIAKAYELVVNVGVYRAASIKVAEAAKVIENSQRDVNIAFMNEIAMIFNRMGIDTHEVLQAAGTKWNFLNFTPGLVGGHCIGVDPYYLTYRSEQIGYRSQLILAGRRINDDMGKFVVENTIKLLIKAGKNIKESKIAILGFAFKENCPDTRNTRVIDIVNELREYGIEPIVTDPVANKEEAWEEYGINIKAIEEVNDVDAIILAVAHDNYKELTIFQLDELYKLQPNTEKVIVDIKSLLNITEIKQMDYNYWRL